MRSSKYSSVLILVLFTSLLMTGCGPGQLLGPTLTPTSTNTPVPSATASTTPTLTPSKTATPSPTMTATLTPTIEPPSQLSDFLENPRLTFYDSFDRLSLEIWATNGCQTVSNGVLEYSCNDEGPLVRKYTFLEGEGVLVDFKTIEQDNGIFWGINFSSGDFKEDNWRIFGVAESQNRYEMPLMQAQNWFGSNIYWIKPDIWYRLALAVGEDGRIMLLAWERDNPDAQPWKYRNTLGDAWDNLEWLFWVNNGQPVTLYFDNFHQIEFDKIY